MGDSHDAEHETLREVEADLTEDFENLDNEVDDEAADGATDKSTCPLQQFIHGLREADDTDVRAVGQYDGEDYELLYLRPDVDAQLDDEARVARVKSLVMKALGEPISDPVFEDYGKLNAAIRWYDEAVVAIYPYDEWSGVIATFDRANSPLVNLALEHLE
ncbi:hypothetical protein [Haloferax larsenii]|uniref:Uncharacterized protein n=1 Tax=Haloferax larsenii TaxID=302484 RepID=A0A1H7M1T6_HALLR|nr:hypothetical protein [Haloferax larsenii]SEL04567.1 hypothetical protein SAMN04488691_102468 [Haloferax larsenii]